MKSFLAVLAGLVFTIVISTCLDLLMYQTGVFSSDAAKMTTGHWLIATGYRLVVAIIGCWLTARLAPANKMKHALILGGIGTAIAAAGAAWAWNKGPQFGPHWYPIVLVITALPCAWIGGRLGSDRVPA